MVGMDETLDFEVRLPQLSALHFHVAMIGWDAQSSSFVLENETGQFLLSLRKISVFYFMCNVFVLV
jgi:hypothetical protein